MSDMFSLLPIVSQGCQKNQCPGMEQGWLTFPHLWHLYTEQAPIIPLTMHETLEVYPLRLWAFELSEEGTIARLVCLSPEPRMWLVSISQTLKQIYMKINWKSKWNRLELKGRSGPECGRFLMTLLESIISNIVWDYASFCLVQNRKLSTLGYNFMTSRNFENYPPLLQCL